MRYELVALALVFAGVLWWMHRWNRVNVKRLRSVMYDAVMDLFEDPEITQDDVNFPVMRARYRGREVTLEPIVDHVNVRKIPSLWLKVTVRDDLPYKGSMDFLVRPQNTEFYSPSSLLNENLPIPAGWPKHAVLHTDNATGMPPIKTLTPHMVMFDEPKMKELLITPRGVRLVYQLDQATRSNYMVLRQLIFDEFAMQPELTMSLLDKVIAVIEDLKPTSKATGSEWIA